MHQRTRTPRSQCTKMGLTQAHGCDTPTCAPCATLITYGSQPQSGTGAQCIWSQNLCVLRWRTRRGSGGQADGACATLEHARCCEQRCSLTHPADGATVVRRAGRPAPATCGRCWWRRGASGASRPAARRTVRTLHLQNSHEMRLKVSKH